MMDLSRHDQIALNSLVGRTIVSVGFDPGSEGTFILILDDGRKVEFTSIGDDMTATLIYVE